MDDDFDYGDDVYERSGLQKEPQSATPSLKGRSTITVQNQPHDEEVALSESESLASPDEQTAHRGSLEPSAASQLEASAGAYSLGSAPASPEQRPYTASSSSQASPTGTGYGQAVPAGQATAAPAASDGMPGYSPDDYAHLQVSGDVQDLFKYISRYQPQTIQLASWLKPFIPDFIPAIGGTDEFIKVPRPDGRPDYLGLKVLDEPAAVQSDPTLLNLQLRQLSKDTPGVRMDIVGRIDHNDKDKQQRLSAWISSITDIHKHRPTAAVSYSRPMPDIEALMQEWPPKLEAAYHSTKLPTADLDLDLLSYSKLVCALTGVPVYDNVIESLHVLFTLFLEFKQNPFFRQQVGTD